jgi:hypothetical protein
MPINTILSAALNHPARKSELRRFIADYIDQRGNGTGTLLSLAPELHIVLAGSERNHKPLHSVGLTCPRCRKVIEGRNIYPHPEDVRVLSCTCIMVIFGASSFQADWVLKHWKPPAPHQARCRNPTCSGRQLAMNKRRMGLLRQAPVETGQIINPTDGEPITNFQLPDRWEC